MGKVPCTWVPPSSSYCSTSSSHLEPHPAWSPWGPDTRPKCEAAAAGLSPDPSQAGHLAAGQGGQPPGASRNSSPIQGGATHYIPCLGEEGGALTWPGSVIGRLNGELSAPPNWPFSLATPPSGGGHHPFFPRDPPPGLPPLQSISTWHWHFLREGSLMLLRRAPQGRLHLPYLLGWHGQSATTLEGSGLSRACFPAPGRIKELL